MKDIKDVLIEKARWKIDKYDSDGELYETREIEDNTLLNEGINELTKLIGSASGTKWDNTNAFLGVGDSGASESATDTGLLADTNKVYQGMEDGYPTYGASQKITWKASFDSTTANHGWKEFTVANDSANTGVNLNRKTSDEGTKSSGQTWELSLEITFS